MNVKIEDKDLFCVIGEQMMTIRMLKARIDAMLKERMESAKVEKEVAGGESVDNE